MSIEKNKEPANLPENSKLTLEEFKDRLIDVQAIVSADFYCAFYDAVSLMDKPSQ